MVEERDSKFEDRTIQIIQFELNKEIQDGKQNE